MIRKIIEIDEKKCNGCGICANACREGAIEIIEGKARLVRDDYCDGLGDCLPACPEGAISFVEREAAAYDKEAVSRSKTQKNGCQPSAPVQISRTECRHEERAEIESRLSQWPVQIKLVPVKAPFFDNADVLVAADCTAFAYGDFHRDFMENKVTVIGCPKLDGVDYSEKLAEILAGNDIKSVTVLRMEVPCCGGLENAARSALDISGKKIPLKVVTITTDGHVKQ